MKFYFFSFTKNTPGGVQSRSAVVSADTFILAVKRICDQYKGINISYFKEISEEEKRAFSLANIIFLDKKETKKCKQQKQMK